MNIKSNMQEGTPVPARVAIIGAGVAGVATAGALSDYGIPFVVFDKNDRAGGLWADNYPNAKVQSTFELYEFPCKRYPSDIRNRKNPPAPTGEEVCTYLDEYICEKGIQDKFRFNTAVRGILCESETQWIVEFEDLTSESFTFVIVCNGLVSQEPNKIRIPGDTEFIQSGGIIQHSSERRSDEELFHNKRVLVIGNGKSAVDAAIAACTTGSSSPPIQMVRRQVWYVPRYVLGLVPYKYFFHSRIGSALLPRYYETRSKILILLHWLFTPFKWLVWRLMGVLLLLQFRLPARLWPPLGAVQQAALENSVLITDESHLRRVRRGEVDMRVGTVERLEAGKAFLSSGTTEEVDVIIVATGWKLSFNRIIDNFTIFSGLDCSKSQLDFCDDGLWLYRNILPAGFKGMAFVGSNTLTFMNIFTAYIQAYWLAQLLAGERSWPTEEQMTETVQREKQFKRDNYRKCVLRGASIEAYMQHYHDVLYKEMGAKQPFPCIIRPIANLVVPIVPSRMKGCLEPPQVEEKNHDVEQWQSPEPRVN